MQHRKMLYVIYNNCKKKTMFHYMPVKTIGKYTNTSISHFCRKASVHWTKNCSVPESIQWRSFIWLRITQSSFESTFGCPVLLDSELNSKLVQVAQGHVQRTCISRAGDSTASQGNQDLTTLIPSSNFPCSKCRLLLLVLLPCTCSHSNTLRSLNFAHYTIMKVLKIQSAAGNCSTLSYGGFTINS